jgi:CRISPR/Cas system CSM-associated protein Csm4 (group 5 of RAMP superfamily)
MQFKVRDIDLLLGSVYEKEFYNVAEALIAIQDRGWDLNSKLYQMTTPDMTAFEMQFSEGRLSNVMDNDTFERVAELRDRIADLEDVIDFRNEAEVALNLELADIEEIEREVRKFLAKIMARKQPFEDQRRRIRNSNRTDQKELERLRREWAKLQAELEALLKLRRDRMEIDHSTKDAPWRARAKKHQLEGAHRLVAADRAILADKPGLGKTLQSIMAINMLREKGKGKKVLVFTFWMRDMCSRVRIRSLSKVFGTSFTPRTSARTVVI